MKVVLTGGTVLNQDNDNPMSGTIEGRSGRDDEYLRVRWVDGIVSDEWPADVTLTGDARFEIREG